MESMAEQEAAASSCVTPAFKADIVAACRAGDRSAGQVAKDVDLTETAVRAWVKQADLDEGTRSDLG